MRKIILFVLVTFLLSACSFPSKKKEDSNDRYYSIVENIFSQNDFARVSNYFDISGELAKIDDGYRFYITIDNPRNALYDVEALAVEQGVDYTSTMAANVGIYDEKEFCLIPNQTNPNKGYVEGLVISGVTQNPETTLYVYVSFKNDDHSSTRYEYLSLDVEYQEQ